MSSLKYSNVLNLCSASRWDVSIVHANIRDVIYSDSFVNLFLMFFLIFFNHETNYFAYYRHKGSMFDEQYIDSLDTTKLCTLFKNEHTCIGM